MGRFSEHTPFRRVDIRSTGAVFRRLAPHFDSRTSSEFDPCRASCARPWPLVLGAITGLICALSFAMPAFVHLRNISPMRVLRRDLDISPASRLLSYGAAILGSLTLLVWHTESLFLTF